VETLCGLGVFARKNIVEVFLLNIPAEQLDGLMNLVIVRVD